MVKIHHQLLLCSKAFGHSWAPVLCCPHKTSFLKLSNIFPQHCGKSEVNEDWPLVGRTHHYIVRLNVLVHNMESVHDSQCLVELLGGESGFGWLQAHFHPEFYALLKHQDIESEIGFHLRPYFQH